MLDRIMLGWMAIVGGVLIMIGHCSRGEALFYYFRLAEPQDQESDEDDETWARSARPQSRFAQRTK